MHCSNYQQLLKILIYHWSITRFLDLEYQVGLVRI